MRLRPTFCLLAYLCLTLTLHAEAPRQVAPSFPLLDVNGKTHALEQNDAETIRVFVFLSTECPIARGYTKTLNALHDKWRQAEKVELFGVISDPTVTCSAAAVHFKEFHARFPVLFDGSLRLARLLKPTHTPEAFVLSADGELAYRGAIDDAYKDVGRRRPEVEHHYLVDAVTATLAGKPVATSRIEPIGCFFELPPAADGNAKVTYNRDIAPILQTRCMSCHREGQVAPFPLTSYEDAAKRARQMARVTRDRIMPPWMPAPGHKPLVGERWLTDREIELFAEWAQTGRARGDAEDLPPAPEFAAGWRLGKPDLVLKMPKPFTVPADGPDLFQHFVIPVDIPADKLVATVEFHPGNKRVVHHSVLFLDDKGAARKLDEATPEPGYGNFGGPGFLPSGAIGGWSVGNTPRRLPNNMGRYLKKGSDLVMQIHYHPSGREEVDQSEVGIYFVDKPMAELVREGAKIVGSIWMANYQMDIPPGEQNYRRRTSYTLPKDVLMVGVVPHMHLLGKSMQVTATLPGGKQETLLSIENWNYNWQDEYYYERPFKLPAGTRLEVEAVYDNSSDNPSNPNSPPQRVTWGDETTDEMLFCFFLLTSDKTEDLIHVIYHNLAHDARQPRKPVAKEGE